MKEKLPRAEAEKQLDALILRIEEVVDQRGLTVRDLLRSYPDLGSEKTWVDRLKPRDYTALNVYRWIVNLTRVCTIIDGGYPDEFYSTEMPFHSEMLARVLKLEHSTTDRRILSALAANGCGKTRFSRYMVMQDAKTRRLVRIRPTWRNRPLHLYNGIAQALGCAVKTSNVAAVEEAVVLSLISKPMTLFVDQAHEGGVALMHILRCLVDETPARFVYLAYDTAYRSVITGSSDALVEAKAFIGRCIKPVFDLYANGVRVGDVQHLLEVSAGLREAAAKSLAAELQPMLASGTNLRLLEDAITASRTATDTDDPPAAVIKAKVIYLNGAN